MIKNVTAADFEQEVLKAELPVLVDFWADWCGPCRMVAPVLEQIDEELEGRLKIVKVNVDEESDLAGEYGIMSIPTLMVFKNGENVDTTMGFNSKAHLLEKIQAFL